MFVVIMELISTVDIINIITTVCVDIMKLMSTTSVDINFIISTSLFILVP